jgi:hypothetical protein
MAAPSDGTGEVVSPADRKPWSGSQKTADTRFQTGSAGERSSIALEQARRYLLVGNHACGSHVLGLRRREGIAPLAFTFTGCLYTPQAAPTAVVEGQS